MAQRKKTGSRSPATLRDVARLSGMGTTAVSRYISGKGYVSDEAKARIAEAVARTGYRRNHHASLLKSGDRRQLGLILGGPDKVRAWTRHFFMGEKFLAVVEAAAREKHELILLPLQHLEGPEAEGELRQKHVSGAILLDPVGAPLHDILHRLDIPHVLSNFEHGERLEDGWNWSGKGRNGVLTDYGRAVDRAAAEAKARGYRTLALDEAMLRVILHGDSFVRTLCRRHGLGFARVDGMDGVLPVGTLALLHNPRLALNFHPRAVQNPRSLGLITFNLDPLLEDLPVRPAHLLQDAQALGREAVLRLIDWVAAGEANPPSVYVDAVFVEGGTLIPCRAP